MRSNTVKQYLLLMVVVAATQCHGMGKRKMSASDKVKFLTQLFHIRIRQGKGEASSVEKEALKIKRKKSLPRNFTDVGIK